MRDSPTQCAQTGPRSWGFPADFTRPPNSGWWGQDIVKKGKGWSPYATHTSSSLDPGPTFPLGSPEGRSPPPQLDPGHMGGGGLPDPVAQVGAGITGFQTKRGCLGQEDEGSTTHQQEIGWEQLPPPSTPKNPPPGEAGRGSRPQPTLTHCPAFQERSSVYCNQKWSKSTGPLHPPL